MSAAEKQIGHKIGRGLKYYGEAVMDSIQFPDASLRHVGHMIRDIKPIPEWRAIVDINTDETFYLVKKGYKIVQHPEVIDTMNKICEMHPEWGQPSKELWLSQNGARMHIRYTFRDIEDDIRPGDVIHPTMEGWASLDTSMKQRFLVGAYRLVCTNGMIIGRKFGEYTRKHTEGLNLEEAALKVSTGMSNYSEVKGLWISLANRLALPEEVFYYEAIDFQKPEKENIEREIRSQGKVLAWDYDDREKCKVEINAWDLYNILTAEATHRVNDIKRQVSVGEDIAAKFIHVRN